MDGKMGRSPRGGHGNPVQYPCLENPMDRGAWRAPIHRATKSRTQPNQLSMHASAQVWGTQGCLSLPTCWGKEPVRWRPRSPLPHYYLEATPGSLWPKQWWPSLPSSSACELLLPTSGVLWGLCLLFCPLPWKVGQTSHSNTVPPLCSQITFSSTE